jgi:SPP1 gp7 family putative phage head morphogenesis protein
MKSNNRATEVATQIYNGTFDGLIDPDMTKDVASELTKAMTEGYAIKDGGFKYGTPDYNMVANLERNVYQFSAAKNYNELKTMTLALKDDKGNIRSLSDFKVVTGQIDDKYKEWQQTEYNQAIAGSQMASKWAGFPKGAMLEYRTAGDARVRDDHRALDGVIKSQKDVFWNKYYPPNGWGCRCTVIEVDSESEATKSDEIQYPKVPQMWQVNTAKEGLLFPPGHPYYKDIPSEVLKRAKSIHASVVRENVRAWSKENISEYGTVFRVNTEVFSKLTVRHGDIKAITGKPHKDAAEVYGLSERLDEVVSNSEYIISGDDNGSHPSVKRWHYFKIQVNKNDAFINIMETTNNEFRVHYIGDHFDTSRIINSRKIKKS